MFGYVLQVSKYKEERTKILSRAHEGASSNESCYVDLEKAFDREPEHRHAARTLQAHRTRTRVHLVLRSTTGSPARLVRSARPRSSCAYRWKSTGNSCRCNFRHHCSCQFGVDTVHIKHYICAPDPYIESDHCPTLPSASVSTETMWEGA